MTTKHYTASVISMRSCPSTGHWDLYLCDSLPQRETLGETIKQCFMPTKVMAKHLKQHAVPTLIEIRSQDGLVALADVAIEENPFKISVLWRDELSADQVPGLEKSRAYNQTKAKKVLFDIMDANDAASGEITVQFLDLLLESKSYVEPIGATMKLIYDIERAMGKQTNRVHRLENELGM